MHIYICKAPHVCRNTPGLWGLTRTPGGQNYSGLVIVDGRVLTLPFLDAMRTGLVDVSAIIGNMGQEPVRSWCYVTQYYLPQRHMQDASPDNRVKQWNLSEWNSFLNTTFQAWGADTGALVYAEYADSALVDRQKAYDEITTDYGLTCANIDVGVAAKAGGSYRSPVYIYVNQWMPGVPIKQSESYSVEWAFHTWDLTNAFESWGSYEPIPSDLQQSQLQQKWWYEFMATGKLGPASGWQTIDAAPGFPSSYNVFVIGDQLKPPYLPPTAQVNYKQVQCTFWADLMGSTVELRERFWWCD